MIKLSNHLSDNIVCIVASGQVSAGDYETVLVPAVEAALRMHPKLRLLYKVDSDFTGFTAGAMWDDLKLGVRHLRAWEKIAVVTDVQWMAGAASMFRLAVPCPVKVFPLAEESLAERWIAA